MSDNTVQFLPFHAINEFMRPDFRLSIIKQTLSNLNKLPKNLSEPLNRQIKRAVKVPGFRNSEKAPPLMKALPASNAFEKNPDLVATFITAWSELHADLRSQVYSVLKLRGWKMFPEELKSASDIPPLQSESDWGVLPVDINRTQLPGFLTYWPKNQEFDMIYETYVEQYPEENYSVDEVSLMTVWLCNRLPYQIVGVDGEIKEEDDLPSEG